MLTTALVLGLVGQTLTCSDTNPCPTGMACTARLQCENILLTPLPLAEDILRAPPGNKHVVLALDISSSMNAGAIEERYCLAWNQAHAPGMPAPRCQPPDIPCAATPPPGYSNVPEGWIPDNVGAPFACAQPTCQDSNFMEDCIPTLSNTWGGIPCNPNGPGFMLNKMQQLKAGLTGCITGNDGIFSRWARQIDFGIVAYGFPEAPGSHRVLNFSRNVSDLRNAVDALSARGGTPMTEGLLQAGLLHQYWTNGTPGAASCDQFYTVLMTDGIANDLCREGPGAAGDYVDCAPDDFSFRTTCGGPTFNPPSPPTPQGLVNSVRYTYTNTDPVTQIPQPDAVCGLDGVQAIRTYTVGFGQGRLIDAPTLQRMARAGGGQYYFAGNARALDSAFQSIIQSIVNRSASFTAPTVQTQGLYHGNRVFATSFRPAASGPWTGNMKSYCVTPATDLRGNYVLTDTNCLFRAVADPAGGPPILQTNVAPADTFSGTRSLAANTGGVGQNIFRDYFGGATPTSTASAFGPDYFSAGRRHVMTWDARGYKDARPSTMTDAETFSDGCNKVRLFSYLYGYNPSSVDCNPTAENPFGHPTELSEWPFGAPVNAQPALLRWADDCSVGGNCIVAVGADDGGIHFVDVSNGRETAMLVPKELWTPGYVANYPLADIFNQPTGQLGRRPYVDGSMVIYHDDQNGNGIIDNNEDALLIVGLGKGGKELLFMDVKRRFPGPDFKPTTANNPIFPLAATPGTWAKDMRNQEARPWLGRVRFNPRNPAENVAVFASGNVWYLDNPNARFNVDAVGLQPPVDYTAHQPLTCAQFAYFNGAPPGSCEPGANDPQCPCTAFNTVWYDCQITGCAPGFDMPPRSFVIGPFNYQSVAGTPARALGQFTFSLFDLGDGDSLIFEDVQGNQLLPPITGTHAAPFVVTKPDGSPFWAPTPFNVRVSFSGHYSGNLGFALASMEWVPDCNGGGGGHSLVEGALPDGAGCAQVPASIHNPFVVAIDLHKINGPTNGGRPFSDTVQNGSTRLMFTRRCPAGFSGGTCYDQGNATSRDLQFMRCPIVAEVRAFEEGGVATKFYVGDQCGQMWKFWTENNGASWHAKRVLIVDENFSGGLSSEYRRFDRPVDLAVSQCTGGRTIAVYFGTGNTARPGARDNLRGPDVPTLQPAGTETGHDVIGVWFDDGHFDSTNRPNDPPFRLTALKDLTAANPTDRPIAFDPRHTPADAAFRGWFIGLQDYEQMLRDPLVLLGTGYFKTNLSTRAPAACVTAQTRDFVYAVNNCTGEPANPGPQFGGHGTANDRIVWQGDQSVGSNIAVIGTPGGPMASVLDGGRQGELAPHRGPKPRALRMYLWWRAT